MILPLLLAACLIDDTRSPTPTLAWDQLAPCPCTLAPCGKTDGYRLTWSLSSSGPWLELVRLPCTPAWTEVGEDGVPRSWPRWCHGVDHQIPLSRWIPPTPAGSEVFVRVQAISDRSVLSCAPATFTFCWPLIRELP